MTRLPRAFWGIRTPRKTERPMYKHFFKRLIDIVLSLIGIVVLALPMLIVAVIIKIDSPGPVFFRQKRIGYKGRVFEIIKYRTMCVGAEQMGTGVYSGNGDTRVTKVGKFQRKTSFDEVPQLFNTLSGSMSFIGPRPPLTYHLWPIEEYTPEQRRMFDVRPGITGWAQCHGRNSISWTEKFKLDVWYVDHCSLITDIKVIFITIKKVLLRDGISQEGQATMEPFNGNN